MAIGLILEANPFHFGHKHLIDEVKKMYPHDEIIAITSTSFSMRGEISLLDKFQKTQILLDEKIDVVLELPITKTIQSADYFCENTVCALNELGVKTIVVGAEYANISFLEKAYEITSKEDFLEKLKFYLQEKYSLKKAYEKALLDFNFSNEEIRFFQTPNMTLAFGYFKTIKNKDFDIKLVLIQRTNDYYQEENRQNSNIVSSSFIRNSYLKNEKIDDYLPYKPDFLSLQAFENKMMTIINYHLISNTLKEPYHAQNEGLPYYIIKNGKFDGSYSDLIESLANKKYTRSRIRRIVLATLIDVSHSENSLYIRILGINAKGLSYIKTLPKEKKEMIFSGANEITKNDQRYSILQDELKATKLYAILSGKNDLLINEYKLPIKKEGI